MGLITGWRISFFSSAESAAELISKMQTGDAISAIAYLKGERLLRVLAKTSQDKREELLCCMGPNICSKLFDSLDPAQIIYITSSVSLRTRRIVVCELPIEKILEILSGGSVSEKASFLALLSSDKISDVLKKMDEQKSLHDFMSSLERSDRIELILSAEPDVISRVVKGWKKDEILEVAEKIPQKLLKTFLDGMPESARRIVLRKLSIDRLMLLVTNMRDKASVLDILKSAGVEVFARIIAKLPQKQVSSILSFFSREEKKELFERFDLSKMMDIISSWKIEEQAECIELMGTERASLLIDEIPVGSKIEILKMIPPDKGAGILELRDMSKLEEIIKALPLKNMVRIFEYLPFDIQKVIMEGWSFKIKSTVFNEMNPSFASRILKSLHLGGRLKIIEGVKSKQCADIMSGWDVSDILNDFREAAFTSHIADIIKRMDKGVQKDIISQMDLVLKNRLGF